MPLANFHRNCWREDKTHALYVFSILSPSIDVSTAHVKNISREIYIFAQTLLIGGKGWEKRWKWDQNQGWH